MTARHNDVARNYFGHRIVGEIQDGFHFYKVKPYNYHYFRQNGQKSIILV